MSALNEILDDLKEEGILEADEKGYRGVEIIETATIPELENAGWIPVEERLPEDGITVWVTVKHSEWISEYIPMEEWEYHPETNGTYKGKYEEGAWWFEDEENEWIRCDGEAGETRNLGRIYDTVTAWMPLPEPYQEKENKI